ncbi:MAG TPA: hypothetical protein VMR34_02195 [Candidatus Saccharimonadales bacterium]|nr:hypothetical protein [Candidatus Saccharimonadales bacterium]
MQQDGDNGLPADSTDDADNPNSEIKNDSVSWTASEFIGNSKKPSWFIVFGVIIVGVAGGVYLWTRDLFSGIMIIVIGIIFAIVSAKQPKNVEYSINPSGIQIGNKSFDFTDFKSFSVIDDEDKLGSVVLLPIKRFSPPISLYYDRNDEDKILDAVSLYVPHEESKVDTVDKLIRKIRF